MEDYDILKLYLDREEGAIDATSEKYGSFCKSISMNILDSEENANECVDETCKQAWSMIPPKLPMVFPAFLGNIVRKISFGRYIEPQKQGNPEMKLILDELGEIVEGCERADDKIDQKALLNAIDDFLYSISVYKRILFVRRYWNSDKVSDIAERYRHGEKSISANLSKIGMKLREYLQQKDIALCSKEELYVLLGGMDETAVEAAFKPPVKNHSIRRLIISTVIALLVGLFIAAVFFIMKILAN